MLAEGGSGAIMGITRTVAGVLILSLTATCLVATTAAEQTSAGCVARLDGERFPFLIPEYHVWTDVFGRAEATQGFSSTQAVSNEPQLSEAGSRALHSIGSAAIKRATALKATPIPSRGVSPETAAADLILEARDDLLRSLSATDSDRLLDHVEATRRKTRYTFATSGVTATHAQVFKCPISIKGKEHPELIPEIYYWELHFRILASISEKHRVGPAAYASEYMTVLREQRLPIPERDVVTVLTLASATTPDVDAARTAPHDGREAEAAVATIIRGARLTLLRRLSRDSWLVVQRDAAVRRGGMVFDFPTTD